MEEVILKGTVVLMFIFTALYIILKEHWYTSYMVELAVNVVVFISFIVSMALLASQ